MRLSATLFILAAVIVAGCGAFPAIGMSGRSVPAVTTAQASNPFVGLQVTRAVPFDEIYCIVHGRLKDGRKLSMNNVDGLFVDLGDDSDVVANPRLARQLSGALDALAAHERSASRRDVMRTLVRPEPPPTFVLKHGILTAPPVNEPV